MTPPPKVFMQVYARLQPARTKDELHPDDQGLSLYYRFDVFNTADPREAGQAAYNYLDSGEEIAIVRREDFSIDVFTVDGRDLGAAQDGDQGSATVELQGSSDTAPWE